MAPQYKLSYFESRGLAEPIRLIFAYKGIEFTDTRYDYTQPTWTEKKKETPWGTLPMLEEDGKPLCQSQAIQRYLAKKYNLAGETDWEVAKCDELVEAMTDLRTAAFKAFFETDAVKKAEAMTTLEVETFPKYLKKFSEILEKNGGKYLVGKGLTYADLNIASFLDIFTGVFKTLLDHFPLIKAHQETVFNTAGIKEWVAKRPKTQY